MVAGPRHRGRALALQLLYQLDARALIGSGEDVDIEAELAQQRACFEDIVSNEALLFARELCEGVSAELSRVDGAIEAAAANWRLSRMDLVDRNVLRLATWELMRADVPAGAVINEAVELAKRYGSAKSGSFVNGVLDKVARSL
ncbi:MAG: transcription antitermination factor NusB [Myxococcales bacterium]|nr:transcription antitermination factor NusB [Myxococcales bacterium]